MARQRNEDPPTDKTEAKAWRDRLRGEIRKGDFVEPKAAPTVVETRLTFGDVVTEYRKRYVNVPTRRPSARKMFEIHLGMLERATVPAANGATVTLKTKAIDAITKADVEAIREARRAELSAAAKKAPDAVKVRRPGAKAGEVGINRLLARLRHLCAWAVAEGYAETTPFKRNGVTVIKLEHAAEGRRERRLEAGEEAKLLDHADAHLKAVIIAALSTGCRLGELLSLTWGQVRRDAKDSPTEIVLPAGRTKTRKARVIPIGSKLRAVLELRRHAPDGTELPATAHVFGNEVGEEITSIRTAWEKTCSAADIVGLHVHDLRREFACRLLESAADLHVVRDFLGHGDVSTTNTYLSSTTSRLAKALERMEEAGLGSSSLVGPQEKDQSEQSTIQ